jgi:hypothetical protein
LYFDGQLSCGISGDASTADNQTVRPTGRDVAQNLTFTIDCHRTNGCDGLQVRNYRVCAFRAATVVSMLFLSWLLVPGACIEIAQAVIVGHSAGFFHTCRPRFSLGLAGLLIVIRPSLNIKSVL